MQSKGKLYLLPTPLGTEGLDVLPQYVLDRIHSLSIFIAEKAKTARHFIKATNHPSPISELVFFELNKRIDPSEWQQYLTDANNGKNIGLLSEAGCPGVADPGAEIVKLAHQPKKELLPKEIKRLEITAKKYKQTQIFIETPYRNKQILEQAFKHLNGHTHFCIAMDLTLPTQYIVTKKIADWKKTTLPEVHKRPAVFLIY